MATSGTVGQTIITAGDIVDHAHRRCKLIPQQISGEMIATALRLLWMKMVKLNERGIALWVIDTQLLGLNLGLGDITTSVGDIALLNSNLRQISRISGSPTTGAGGSPGNAYDQDLTTACTNSAPNGNIDITFDVTSVLTQVGFLPAVSGTWSYTLQWYDGTAWHVFATVTNQVITANRWQWYDLDGVPAATAFRLQATGGTTLSVFEINCGNNPSDIPMAPIARDTWTQLPNKPSQGRPTLYYWDRRITTPIMHIWQTPAPEFTLNYLLVNYVQRQLQDVGTMDQQIELPDRWYLPIIADLAREVGAEAKEVPPDLVAVLDARADLLLTEAWNGESNGAPVHMIPNYGIYTR